MNNNQNNISHEFIDYIADAMQRNLMPTCSYFKFTNDIMTSILLSLYQRKGSWTLERGVICSKNRAKN